MRWPQKSRVRSKTSISYDTSPKATHQTPKTSALVDSSKNRATSLQNEHFLLGLPGPFPQKSNNKSPKRVFRFKASSNNHPSSLQNECFVQSQIQNCLKVSILHGASSKSEAGSLPTSARRCACHEELMRHIFWSPYIWNDFDAVRAHSHQQNRNFS